MNTSGLNFQPSTPYERFKDNYDEYVRIYGAREYTGNKDRDAEFAKMKAELNNLRQEKMR